MSKSNNPNSKKAKVRRRLPPAPPVARRAPVARSAPTPALTPEAISAPASASAPAPDPKVGRRKTGGRRKLPRPGVTRRHVEAINRSNIEDGVDKTPRDKVEASLESIIAYRKSCPAGSASNYFTVFAPVSYVLYWFNSKKGLVNKESLLDFNKRLIESLTGLCLSDSIFNLGAFKEELRGKRISLNVDREGSQKEQFDGIILPMVFYHDVDGELKVREFNMIINPVISGGIGFTKFEVMAECLFERGDFDYKMIDIIKDAVVQLRDKMVDLGFRLVPRHEDILVVFPDGVAIDEVSQGEKSAVRDISQKSGESCEGERGKRAITRLDKGLAAAGKDKISFAGFDEAFNGIMRTFLFPEKFFVGDGKKGYHKFFYYDSGMTGEDIKRRSRGVLSRNGYDPMKYLEEGAEEDFDRRFVGEFFESIFKDLCLIMTKLNINPFTELDGFGKFRQDLDGNKFTEIDLVDYLKLKFAERCLVKEEEEVDISKVLEFIDVSIDNVAEGTDVSDLGFDSDDIMMLETIGNIRDFIAPYKDSKGKVVFYDMFWEFFGKMESALNGNKFADLNRVNRDRESKMERAVKTYQRLMEEGDKQMWDIAFYIRAKMRPSKRPDGEVAVKNLSDRFFEALDLAKGDTLEALSILEAAHNEVSPRSVELRPSAIVGRSTPEVTSGITSVALGGRDVSARIAAGARSLQRSARGRELPRPPSRAGGGRSSTTPRPPSRAGEAAGFRPVTPRPAPSNSPRPTEHNSAAKKDDRFVAMSNI